MRSTRTALVFTMLFLVVAPVAARAQRAQSDRVLDITESVLDRLLGAHEKEKEGSEGHAAQLADVDARIAKFEQCKRDFEAAGSAVGGRLGGIAARGGIRAKCGASDADGMRKERQQILDAPEASAASAGGFTLPEYRRLRDRVRGYLAGDRSGFTQATLDLLKARETRLTGAFGMPVAVAGGGGMGAARGMRGPAVWTSDFAWLWISQLFAVQYLSGATMFEKDYAPGDWTRWTVRTDEEGTTQEVERAFIGKQADGAEWWRMKTITRDRDGADTVSLEALFRPEPDNEYVRRLVRMRAKLPGSAEPQEMMVPEQWATWNLMGAFPFRPTPESIEGATVGTEDVRTPAGAFRAKHVRFGQGGGTISWWLDESVTGGWVKFAAVDDAKQPRYTMELTGKGTGAKSELGVVMK